MSTSPIQFDFSGPRPDPVALTNAVAGKLAAIEGAAAMAITGPMRRVNGAISNANNVLASSATNQVRKVSEGVTAAESATAQAADAIKATVASRISTALIAAGNAGVDVASLMSPIQFQDQSPCPDQPQYWWNQDRTGCVQDKTGIWNCPNCSPGYVWDKVLQCCVLWQDPPVCLPGQHIDPITHECVWDKSPICPIGEHWDDALGKCVPDVIEPICPDGEILDPATGKCVPVCPPPDCSQCPTDCPPPVCPPGYHLDDAGKVCIPDCPCPTYDSNGCLRLTICNWAELATPVDLDQPLAMRFAEDDNPWKSKAIGFYGGWLGEIMTADTMQDVRDYQESRIPYPDLPADEGL